MNRLRHFVAASLLAGPLLLAGCKQGVGERCQVMSDCDDGLQCVIPAGGSAQAGGTCQMPNTGNADMAGDMAATGGDMAGTPADMSQLPD